MLQRRRLAALTVTLTLAICAVMPCSCDLGDPPESEPLGPELEERPTPETGPSGRKGEYLEQDYFWFNDVDGKQQWEDPSSAQFDEDGNEFYIDAKTKQKTDQRPEAEAWISLYDEERERNYYFNELTNVTTWETPYLFGWRRVYVDENNTVIESPEDEWDDDSWTGADEEYDSEAESEDEQPMTEEELAEMEAMFAQQGTYAEEEEGEHFEL